MKILYFTQFFYPEFFGGGEYVFYQWASELTKRGHEVFIITQLLQGTKTYEIVDGIHIFRVGTNQNPIGISSIGVASNLSFLIGSFLKGIQVARKNKIDIIHSNTYIPVISAQACASLLNIPHIATIHDVYYTSRKNFWKDWSNQVGVPKTMGFLGPVIEKLISKMPVSAFHTVSGQSKSDLESIGVSRKISVIPNGIDPNQYEINNITKNQAIFIGRLVFYKNLDVIIDAFVKITKKIPDAKLVIVGNGPLKASLEKKAESLRIKNSILFMGNISHQEKVKLISESRVLLNPSLIEGFGIVVLEGFACGKPIIVSDTKPLSDLVNDFIDGYIISPSDSDAWASRIIELISNHKKSQEMGKVGRQKTISNYSISKLTDDLLELYKQIVMKS